MINEVRGNIWDMLDKDSVVFILTNNSIYNGKNPMGGGIAREALNRNPGVDSIVAECIKSNSFNLKRDALSGASMVRFPTKVSVHSLYSDVELIEDSLHRVKLIAEKFPLKKLYVPRPGCGYGGLDWDSEVKPLCEKYLDNLKNVFVVTF